MADETNKQGISKNHHITGDNMQTEGHSSRRKFVKGAALAVPAVMTLHNGRAMAMVSSVRCYYNDTATDETAMRDDDGNIVYVRVDDEGQITYYGTSEEPGSRMITPSCYTSFTPA